MKENLYQLFPRYPSFNSIGAITYSAIQLAEQNNHPTITMEHIIYGLLIVCRDRNHNNWPWYINPKAYAKRIKLIENSSAIFGIDGDVYIFSSWYQKLFNSNSDFIAKDDQIDYFYLLIFYLKSHKILKSEFNLPTNPDAPYSESFINNFSNILEKQVSTNENDSQDSFLSQFYASPIKIEFTKDLTNLAYKHELNTFVGRETELKRLETILTRMIKNNAILIGESGVGKTSIVEALAMKLVMGKVPKILLGYSILELDLNSAIAGCKYRGDFEDRIKKLLTKFKNSNQKIILFIDEIHLIMGLGHAEDGGALGLSDMLKPFMLNPNIKIVGTSTFKEFKKFESDKALERRIDTITVEEPSFEETLDILRNKKAEFQNNFELEIPDSTLKEVISLSNQFIPERFLPDKAINLLDDACAIKYNSLSNSGSILLPEDILVSVSLLKEIPIDKLRNSNNYTNLRAKINSKVIGQSHAIDSLVNSIRRTQAGLNDENRPFASFMFVGPTGVGKTEVAKTLADFVFSGRENMIRFDMSEYMEEHSVSKLIGSPPGYVGYEEGGLLTDKVHRHPFSLVLFDEIEKAHPKVYNLLLQILDEGALTDSHGEKINFKNTIIILTSNVGIKDTEKFTGFGNKTYSKSQNILSAVKNNFSPEFLNRLDEVILFNYLSEEDILKITNLYISDEIISKLKSRSISIDIPDEVIREISKQGYKEEYGARELKRTVTKMLKNPLADFLIEHPNASKISVALVNNEVIFSSKELVFI